MSSFENKNLPKAGVYAVRQGPILFKNLRAKILNYSLTSFKPQNSFLSLIGNGKDEAIFSWKDISFKSKFAWMLKRYIDEGFMKKYNHFVDGKEMEPNSGEYFDTENPYTWENWAKVAKGNAHDVDIAVNVAKAVSYTHLTLPTILRV